MSLRHDPDGLGLVSGLAGLPLPILEMGLDEPAQCRLRSHDTTTERKTSHNRGWCVLWLSMQMLYLWTCLQGAGALAVGTFGTSKVGRV